MNDKFVRILSDVLSLGASEIQPELQKCDVGTWDSLKQMDLVLSLEREYSITLEIPDIVRMTSVSEIVDVLKAKGIEIDS